jgi:hypothetical protein
MASEVTSFKVRFSTGHYWTVLVFKHKGYMRRAFHQINITANTNDRFGAIVMPQIHLRLVGRKWVQDKVLGYVLFSLTQLDAGTVTHEAVHMATSYMRRIKRALSLGKQVNDREEELAYKIGYVASKLIYELYKRGCYR